MRVRTSLRVALLWVVTACGPSPRHDANCTSVCSSFGHQQCHEDGSFDPPVACGPDEICDPAHGCVVCVPDELYCGGTTDSDVYRCNADGTGGTLVESCPADQVCSNGACKTPCEAALDHPSNVGCDFWAADLDNEPPNIAGDAAAQQLAIIVANNNEYPINVTVTKNAGRVGGPIDEQVVTTVAVPPRVAQQINLPQRELDGVMGQNDIYRPNTGSGTFVSPHAYHVVTTGPAVIYQFNPIVQQFSNDASTLIPIQALGMDYVAVGFETANPCAIAGLPTPDPSIPDHGAITIIAPNDDTHVTVTAGHAIAASAGDSGFPIAETPRGGTLSFTIGRYTAVNLETRQMVGDVFACANAVNGGQNGDFTGTYIKADKPIVVFDANERGLGFGGADNVDYPPGWNDQDHVCCTEHMEEQLLPVTALGREFAIARSPIRSTHPTWIEQDIFRVVGTADGTVITTNLPPPYNSFTVNAREQKTFMARTGFTLTADKAVEVAQYLVAQQFIKDGWIGDPSQLTIPAAEQHRKDYVFLVPTTWTKNYAVFSKPVDAHLVVDGLPLDSTEFSNCTKAPIGTIASTTIAYEQVTCLLRPGHHYATGDLPFGLSVFGYHSVGAYSFVGGSDVKLINPIY